METPDELSPRDGYALWATCYDDDGNPLTALEGPAMHALFGPLIGRRALDVGCGTGRHTEALVRRGAVVAATDQSPEMMAWARRKLAGAGVGWVRHAFPDPLPFGESTFDLAVLGLVAEHLADLPAALVEVARVLAPAGRCLLSALHPDRTAAGQRARFIDPETGLRRPISTWHRTVAEYREAAASAGLGLVEERTLVVDDDLATRLPRAGRYRGMPLGWIGHWVRA